MLHSKPSTGRRFAPAADHRAALAAVAAVALAVRLWDLGSRSLQFDELVSIQVCRSSLAYIVTDRLDVHPRLYFVLLHLWMSLFGDSAIALRTLSVIFGAAAVAAVGLLGFELFGRATGLAAAVGMAVLPFSLHYSREARMYPLAMLAASASVYALVRALRRGGAREWLLYAAATLVLLYTHYFAVFVVLVEVVFVLALHRERARLRPSLAALAAIALGFAPGALLMVEQHKVIANGFWIERPELATLVTTYTSMLGFLVHPALLLPEIALVALAVLGAQSAAPARLGGTRWLLLAWAVVPVALPIALSLVGQPFYVQRYASVSVPAVMLLLGRGFALVRWRSLQAAAAAFVLAVAGLSATRYVASYVDDGSPWAADYYMFPRDHWREAAAFVEGAAQPDDAILVAPWFVPGYVSYYFRAPLAQAPPSGWSNAAALEAATAGKRRLWLVLFRDEPGLEARTVREMVEERWPEAHVADPGGFRDATIWPRVRVYDLGAPLPRAQP